MTKKKHAAKLYAAAIVLAAAFALALALCTGMGLKALAAETATGNGVTEAAITKNLQMDKDVTTPTATFTFDVEKVSLDGIEKNEDCTEMPDILNQSLHFSSEDPATIDATTIDATTRLKEVKKQTENIIPDISQFSHAGVYRYKVTERRAGYAEEEDTSMTYSKAEFTMDIYVKNKDDNSGGLEIGGVYVNYVKDDNGNEKTEKVDPTPGTDPNVSEWQFVNKFKKTNKLTISKTVAGTMGDKKKQFDFSLSLLEKYKYALEAENASYSGTISRADESAASDETTVTLKKGPTPATFTLADGEVLTLTLPVGTTCCVAETADGYTTTVKVISNNAEKTDETDPANASVLVGESTNSVTYTNTKNGNIPTGIVVDNLPFLILILVALCGFAGYVALKRRKYRG